MPFERGAKSADQVEIITYNKHSVNVSEFLDNNIKGQDGAS